MAAFMDDDEKQKENNGYGDIHENVINKSGLSSIVILIGFSW